MTSQIIPVIIITPRTDANTITMISPVPSLSSSLRIVAFEVGLSMTGDGAIFPDDGDGGDERRPKHRQRKKLSPCLSAEDALCRNYLIRKFRLMICLS
jgi:hypothetical protein